MATGDRIDPGPGWRLLKAGERKPEGYEWRNIFERCITGVNIGEKLVPGMDPCRVRIPAPSSVKGIATRATVRVGIWRLPDDIEGGLMVCGTYHTGAPFQWHYNCGERSAVAHLLADRDRLRSELDAARAELARVRAAASGVFAYLDARASFGSGNAPGHAHTRPGIWDDDNGAKSGTECEWCKTWNTFRAELARMGEP